MSAASPLDAPHRFKRAKFEVLVDGVILHGVEWGAFGFRPVCKCGRDPIWVGHYRTDAERARAEAYFARTRDGAA